MAKKPEQKHYFILGKDASIFFDPKTECKVLSKDQSKPDEYTGVISPMMNLAIGAGHIVKLDAPVPKGKKAEEEEEDEEKPKTKEELLAMTDEALEAFYKENFQTSKKDLEKFGKLSHEEKVDFLIEE